MATTKDFNYSGFDKVEVGGAFQVDIAYSDSFKISVYADDFTHVDVEQTDHKLVIKRQGFDWLAPFHQQPRATVTLPALSELSVSGASRVRFENFKSPNDLTLAVSGASQVEARSIATGNLEVKATGASRLEGEIKAAGNVNVEGTGASKIDLAGSGVSAVMKILGASKAELSRFPLQNADLDISGASKVTVNMNGRLDANVSGASNLFWSGSPVMGNIQTSGASTLGRK